MVAIRLTHSRRIWGGSGGLLILKEIELILAVTGFVATDGCHEGTASVRVDLSVFQDAPEVPVTVECGDDLDGGGFRSIDN